MAKKNKLEPIEFEPQGTLIGIATPMRAFQLAHFINKELDIDLASMDDMKIFHDASKKYEYYPVYWYNNPEIRTDFYLFSNFNGETFVFPTLRQMNYFLLLTGAAYDEHIKGFISGLKKITGIQAVATIDQMQVKNMAYFFLDFDEYAPSLKKTNENRF